MSSSVPSQTNPEYTVFTTYLLRSAAERRQRAKATDELLDRQRWRHYARLLKQRERDNTQNRERAIAEALWDFAETRGGFDCTVLRGKKMPKHLQKQIFNEILKQVSKVDACFGFNTTAAGPRGSGDLTGDRGVRPPGIGGLLPTGIGAAAEPEVSQQILNRILKKLQRALSPKQKTMFDVLLGLQREVGTSLDLAVLVPEEHVETPSGAGPPQPPVFANSFANSFSSFSNDQGTTGRRGLPLTGGPPPFRVADRRSALQTLAKGRLENALHQAEIQRQRRHLAQVQQSLENLLKRLDAEKRRDPNQRGFTMEDLEQLGNEFLPYGRSLNPGEDGLMKKAVRNIQWREAKWKKKEGKSNMFFARRAERNRRKVARGRRAFVEFV